MNGLNTPVRLRFAPSPTGGLHIGGVRTALFSYLFAKKHKGKFILRIEDTDQQRYVEGAERYIIEALNWCGIDFDEGAHIDNRTVYAPYRQSERKDLYKQYAEQLIQNGFAYYAFDTEADIQLLRERGLLYNHDLRRTMVNSLTLSESEVQKKIQQRTPYVIRYKNIPHQSIIVKDEIRGDVVFDSTLLDDKILLKSDGMPTYHLAVVVDDFLMKISHVFRGEEWLPSAPVHSQLWKCLGWASDEPHWIHLPLILSPSGQGKLSKREAKQMGFPTFPIAWSDKLSSEEYQGFRELGFLPEAFINVLVLIGWKPNGEQEIFSKENLIHHFDLTCVQKSPARFDFEKACWINGQHLQRLAPHTLACQVKPFFPDHAIAKYDHEKWIQIIMLVKERCQLLTDFWKQSQFFFECPVSYDESIYNLTWDENHIGFFKELAVFCNTEQPTVTLEEQFKTLADQLHLKTGKLMLPFRIMLVGGKFGPHIFDICNIIGMKQVSHRINAFLARLLSS